MNTPPKTNAEWGRTYNVSPRTISTIKRAGISLRDPVAVANWLSTRRSANPSALERVTQILNEISAPSVH